jgi:hypothetical protein
MNEIATPRLCINENKTPTATGQQPFTEGSEEVKSMTPKWTKLAGRLLVGVFVSLAIAGCSSDQPLAPSSVLNSPGGTTYAVAPGDQVQFAARVRTTDQNRLMLTFAGRSDTVVAAHNCEIVRLNNGQDTPIPFSEIHPGDSVNVNGNRQQGQNVTANRLQLCQDGTGCYDVAFRDTILTIDYANNSFTVKGRTEVITVDANTVIWGQIVFSEGPNALGDGDKERHRYNYEYSNGDKNRKGQRDTTLAFSDLAVGDVVEVKANIVSPGILLALTIKVANCGQHPCLEFRSYLASVDVAAKTVTFTDQTWIGSVCQGAKLTGLSDETLTLADFTVGDYVSVKGYVTTEDTLKICQMSKETI